MSAVVVPLEVRGRRFTTKIAIDALIIDVEFSLYVLGIFVCDISHKALWAGSASKVGRFPARAIIFLVDATPSNRQITASRTVNYRLLAAQ
jgi:hypothetical protein